MVDHLIQGYRQRALAALHHHPEGITHQEYFHTGRLDQAGETGVITGQAADLPAGALHLLQLLDGNVPGRHGIPDSVVDTG